MICIRVELISEYVVEEIIIETQKNEQRSDDSAQPRRNLSLDRCILEFFYFDFIGTISRASDSRVKYVLLSYLNNDHFSGFTCIYRIYLLSIPFGLSAITFYVNEIKGGTVY